MVDTIRTITCPACGKELKKCFIEETNITIDICLEGCGGMFFDNRELEKFDEPHENANKIFETIGNKIFEQVDETKIRKCPACNTPMVKLGAANGSIEIDLCNVCGGKFLDNGELKRIRETKLTTSEKTDLLTNAFFEENLKEVTIPSLPGIPGYKERRDTFVNAFKKLF